MHYNSVISVYHIVNLAFDNKLHQRRTFTKHFDYFLYLMSNGSEVLQGSVLGPLLLLLDSGKSDHISPDSYQRL